MCRGYRLFTYRAQGPLFGAALDVVPDPQPQEAIRANAYPLDLRCGFGFHQGPSGTLHLPAAPPGEDKDLILFWQVDPGDRFGLYAACE